jgi:hypothetical protein
MYGHRGRLETCRGTVQIKYEGPSVRSCVVVQLRSSVQTVQIEHKYHIKIMKICNTPRLLGAYSNMGPHVAAYMYCSLMRPSAAECPLCPDLSCGSVGRVLGIMEFKLPLWSDI